MPKLTIVGNSGFARECFIIARALMQRDQTLSFNGFLSFEGYKADLLELSHMFLGNDEDHVFAEDEYAIIGIGDPYIRQKAFEKLKSCGVKLPNLVHPDVYVDASARMGIGNIITSGCYLSCNVGLGDCNVLNGVIHIGHDAQIGDFNFIGPAVQILGEARIGHRNSVGTLCVILPHCRIGNDNKIAPLSAVYKGCRNNSYLIGNPAMKMGTTGVAGQFM